MTAKLKEDTTQFVLIIYHGTTPLPGTPEWESLSKEEQQSAYTDYGALNEEDADAAFAIASRIPQARRGGAVEVRPSSKYW